MLKSESSLDETFVSFSMLRVPVCTVRTGFSSSAFLRRNLRLHNAPAPLRMRLARSPASLESARIVHSMNSPIALINRSGSKVNAYSQASRHANVPNQRTCSNCGGNNMKFNNRSYLTCVDS